MKHMMKNMVLPFALSFSLSCYAGEKIEKTNIVEDLLNQAKIVAADESGAIESGMIAVGTTTENQTSDTQQLTQPITMYTPPTRQFGYIQIKDSVSKKWFDSHKGKMKIGRELDKLKAMSFPSQIDLLINVPNYAAPFDQGCLGSCTGNALAGLVQYDREIEGLGSENISRNYIYWYERFLEGNVDEDSGASLATGLRVLREYGAPLEKFWPYDPATFTQKPSAEADLDAKNNLDLDSNLSVGIIYQNLYALKYTLAILQRPIALGIAIYSSFDSEDVFNTGIVTKPDIDNEPLMGWHAVLAVGYDDAKKQFKIRNSWGTNWGDGGYFYLPYKYVMDKDLASDFITVVRVGKKDV